MDIFGFDEDEYIQKLRLMSLDELRQKEKSKYHSKMSGGTGVVVGVVAASLTGGAALLGSAYGARRMDVAKQKEILVKNELLRREQQLTRHTKRDKLVPVLTTVATAGLGRGVEHAMTSHVSRPAMAWVAGKAASKAVNTGVRRAQKSDSKNRIANATARALTAGPSDSDLTPSKPVATMREHASVMSSWHSETTREQHTCLDSSSCSQPPKLQER